MFPVTDNIPTARLPLATAALILVNLIGYIVASLHGGSLISGPDTGEVLRYGAIPWRLSHHLTHCTGAHAVCGVHPAWESVFTGMFLHASVVQLAGNMLFLWIFGGSVEAALGRLRFVLLYLLAGVAAIALQVLLSPGSTEPTVGAAGAIAGVLGAYIVLYPRGRVLTVVLILVFTVLELPAVAMLVVWFGEQATFAATHLTTPIGGSGLVPFVAHIGGFLFGLATVRLLARRGGMPPPPTLPA